MKFVLLIVVALLLALVVFLWATTSMPGRSYRGVLPTATREQRALAEELRRDVVALSAFAPRSTYAPHELRAASRYLERELPAKQEYVVDGVVCENLEIEIRGTTRADEIVVIGAHYDSIDESPGADDNASGVAALLALARRFANQKPARTLRFVAFVNEEPPHFKTEQMGSYVWAKRAHEKHERIVAMLSLESMGYYDAKRGAQHYPRPLDLRYPKTGDFIAFAGNFDSRELVRQCAGTFRRTTNFPCEGAAVPEVIPEIGWSDQWSFWQFGWPALMVTDTALFRNPHYHQRTDTAEKLDYERMARVVEGVGEVIKELSSAR
ncbi:MAG TPA: M28 family peptidase [Thermoanaerobaculia bacterium]|nr:M28 family peptidase [Thermoanaerobaculia bacterium]